MSDPQRPLGNRLREAGERIGTQIEQELQRTLRYIDEEVVPEVRRNGSTALRTAADRLRGLAERLEDERRRHESPRP